MQNIKLTLQYDGTRYLGWQRPQRDGHEKTVSYKLAAVLKKMTGEDIVLHAGAKTEPGVHATGQTVSFHTESDFSPEQFRVELNRYLPQDIAILEASAAPERFRADLSAVSRTYEYRVCTAKVYDVFTAPYTAHLPLERHAIEEADPLNRNAMEKAASFLTGRHDFRGFSNARPKKKTEKEIYDIRITCGTGTPVREPTDILAVSSIMDTANPAEHSLIITVTANDFLSRMPSLIMGTLMEIGTGKRTPDSIRDILDGREKAAALCDAKGLLLKSVSYNNA